ncbi:MAG: WD40/YVTN/BNR-like repeat-containing protein [Candidatus Aminicenantales bacterium]
MKSRKSLSLLIVLAFAAVSVAGAFAQATDPTLRQTWAAQYAALKAETPYPNTIWRFLGPNICGGRCTDIAVPKGQPNVIYIGSATGGVWKTEDMGATWKPITAELPTPSTGDLAVAESDPNIVWLGTGEANHFRASIAGIGVYKSTDAGRTWNHMGLAGTHSIGRILIHPANSDIVYVAATGHEWTYNSDRGVFKTANGGKTWEKVLYINEKVGAIDLVMDPANPDMLIASMVNRIRRRWSDPVPGGEDGLFKTTDGGKTWKELTNGLPDTNLTGRIGLDICKSKPNVVYAYVDNHNLGREPEPGERDAYGRLKVGRKIIGAEVYRSDDQGEHWTKVSVSDALMETFGGTYGWVFGQIRVDPNDENTVYLMGLGLYVSKDGGKTWKGIAEDVHGDHHGLWINPDDSNMLVNVNDGGAAMSKDGGKAWEIFDKKIMSVQFYNVALDMAQPFGLHGSVQDEGTMGCVGVAPAKNGVAAPVKWAFTSGGEGTQIAVDPTNPNVMYSSAFYGRLMRAVYTGGEWQAKDIYPKAAPGEPDLRGQWLAATILSPHDPKTIYHGFQYVFRSRDEGKTWDKISPDLTAFDPQKQGKLPYAIPFATITSISESPFRAGVLYAGTDDGRVWVTLDGGGKWTEISAGLPANLHVWTIVASKYDPAKVLIALVGRHEDDFTPYIYKSADYGKTWMSLAANMPGGPVNVIREDPKKEGILYAGTDQGIFISRDGLNAWQYLGKGLPNCPVWDIQIHPRDNMMVIATNGRGVWVLDDLSALQR